MPVNISLLEEGRFFILFKKTLCWKVKDFQFSFPTANKEEPKCFKDVIITRTSVTLVWTLRFISNITVFVNKCIFLGKPAR